MQPSFHDKPFTKENETRWYHLVLAIPVMLLGWVVGIAGLIIAIPLHIIGKISNRD